MSSLRNSSTVALLQEAVEYITEKGNSGLATRLNGLAWKLEQEIAQYERDLDHMQDEVRQAELKKKERAAKTQATRKRREAMDQQASGIVQINMMTYRQMILDYLIPTLANCPRTIPIVRDDDTGVIWANLADSYGHSITDHYHDMKTEALIMRAAEMFGFVKRDLTGKVYREII